MHAGKIADLIFESLKLLIQMYICMFLNYFSHSCSMKTSAQSFKYESWIDHNKVILLISVITPLNYMYMFIYNMQVELSFKF